MGNPPLTALVVDDDPIHLEIARSLLQERGYNVRVASNVKSIETAQLDVDLVLLDLNIPEVDGVEFIEALKRCHFAGGLVIVSGAVSVVRKAAAALTQAYGLLLLGDIEKPLTAEKLDCVLTPLGDGGP